MKLRRALLGVLFIFSSLGARAQSGEVIPYFSGKIMAASILNSITVILDSASTGDYLELRIDNSQALHNDMMAWASLTGNVALLLDKDALTSTYRIVKHHQGPVYKHFALIVSKDGSDELLSSLGFALAAALSGMQVSIFFQGSAVKVLERGYKEKQGGINSVFSHNGQNRHEPGEPITSQEKLRELERLGARFYACQPSMDRFKVKPTELIFPDIVLSEYITFMEVLAKADIRFFP